MSPANLSVEAVDGIHVSVRTKLQERVGPKGKRYIVKWRVAGGDHSASHKTKGEATAFQEALRFAKSQHSEGGFDRRTGLPMSMLLPDSPVPFIEVAAHVVASSWARWSPGNRRARVESLARLSATLVVDGRGRPPMDLMRRYAQDQLLPPESARPKLAATRIVGVKESVSAADLATAGAWLLRNSRPVSDLASLRLVEDTLTAVSVRMNGKQYSGDTLQKLRTALSLVCRQAVRDGILTHNPVTEASRKGFIEDAVAEVDPGHVPSAEQARLLVKAVGDVSSTSWQYEAFLTLRWTTGMRHSEALGIHLNRDLTLPTAEGEWGRVVLRSPTVDPGARWTGTGVAHADRPKLKGRSRGATRTVLLPPEAVEALLGFIEKRGVKPGNRLFTNSAGRPFDSSQLGKVWRKARVRAFPDGRFAGLTHYQLRHTSVGVQLRAGVSVPKIAEAVGNSPQTLMRKYARVMATDDELYMAQVTAALAVTGPTT